MVTARSRDGGRSETALLLVIDGGKGIRKALGDVFGGRAVVQHCQVQKARNVPEHLPQERRAYVARQLRDTYQSRGVKTAKAKLGQLASWLEANGEDSAAASLREGLDVTLTVLRLGLPMTLRRTLSTTDPTENLNSTFRRVLRNVKCWRGERMISHWAALGEAEALCSLQRVKGHAQISVLLAALRPKPKMDEQRDVA